MKKIITAGLVVSLFLVGLVSLRVVSANDEPNGNPFQFILDAIAELQTNLQEQISNIQLTPGPQGPQGPQGEQGVPGLPAPTVKIVDANGTLIGYPVEFAEDEFIVYDPTLRALEKPNVLSGQIEGIGAPVILKYATSDCSGQAYASNIGGPLPLLWRSPDIGPGIEFYLPDRTKSVVPPNTYIVKGRKTAGGLPACINPPTELMNASFDFPVNQITLPYVPPFDIVVQ